MDDPSLGRRRVVSAAVVLSAATTLANVLGYALTIVAARSLPQDEFGAFSALLALVIVGNVAALAVQTVVARRTAAGQRPATGAGLLTAVAVSGCTALTSPLIADALRLTGVTPVLAVSAALGGLTIAAVPLGIAQGRESFSRLAVLVALQAGLRVGGGLLGFVLGGSLRAGVAGIAAGLAAAALVAWVSEGPPAALDVQGGHEVVRAAAMLLGLVLLTNADVVLARIVLEPDVSGIYAVGSIVTKVAFWISQFVPLLAFPRLVAPQRRAHALRASLAVVAAIGAGTVTVSWVFADQIVLLVAGDRYLAVADHLALFALLGSMLALTQVSVYAGLARRDATTTIPVWVALAALVAASLALRPDAVGLVVLACVVAATLASVTSVGELLHQQR